MKLLRDLITAALIAAAYPAAVSAGVSAIDGSEPERQARWQEISAHIFGDRPIEAGGDLITIEAPTRAQDPALVPITVKVLKDVGRMKMKFGDRDHPKEATLMIRHPNFSGMQMNQVTRLHTSARYLDRIRVSYGEETVFELTSDISLSSDPVIGFTYAQSEQGEFTVHARDTKGASWEQPFPVPARMNE